MYVCKLTWHIKHLPLFLFDHGQKWLGIFFSVMMQHCHHHLFRGGKVFHPCEASIKGCWDVQLLTTTSRHEQSSESLLLPAQRETWVLSKLWRLSSHCSPFVCWSQTHLQVCFRVGQIHLHLSLCHKLSHYLIPVWLDKCTVLHFFVLFFSPMCSSFLFFTAYSCCRNYMKSRISFKLIQGYSVQTATGMCPIDAIMWVLMKSYPAGP